MTRALRPRLSPRAPRLREELLLKPISPLHQQLHTRSRPITNPPPRRPTAIPLREPHDATPTHRLKVQFDLDRPRALEVRQHRIQHLAHQPVRDRLQPTIAHHGRQATTPEEAPSSLPRTTVSARVDALSLLRTRRAWVRTVL